MSTRVWGIWGEEGGRVGEVVKWGFWSLVGLVRAWWHIARSMVWLVVALIPLNITVVQDVVRAVYFANDSNLEISYWTMFSSSA